MTSATDLIAESQKSPPKPVLQGLLNESEIMGLHGPAESFKTIFSLQMAESLATGTPFLGIWRVPQPRTVYFFETEMSVPALGTRLQKMYSQTTPPTTVLFATAAQIRQFRRATDLNSKFARLSDWIAGAKAEIVILDTANPFFRGKQSANDETTAGAFFDLLDGLPAPTKMFVRHNHKRRQEDSGEDAASKIRGSGQFADVPDLLLELTRADKRTNRALLSATKFRHGSKPDDLELWLDTDTLRLISIPPVIHLLQSRPRTRPDLIADLDRRFGIRQRAADDHIKTQQVYLNESMKGHTRMFQIDWNAATQAEWYPRIERPGAVVGVVQGCISPPLHLEDTSSFGKLI